MNSTAYKVLNTVAALLAARLAVKVLEKSWKLATGDDPPTVPEDPETSVPEAVAWALASGAAMGLARMLATRRTTKAYIKSTGELPKAVKRDVD